MGTVRKVVLASLLSTMIVLMVAIGLMPSLNALGVFASDDGPKDVSDLLDLIMGTSKQIAPTGITQNQPTAASTVRVLQGSTRAQLPINANLDPIGATGMVTFGVDGTVDGGTNTWTGNIVSPTVDAQENIAATHVDLALDSSVVDLSAAAGTVTAHTLYGLASAAKASIVYDVLAAYDLNVEVVDTISPFADLADGEVYLATEPGLDGANTLYTVFADLGVTGTLPPSGVVKGGLDGAVLSGVLSLPVTVDTGAGPLTYTIQAASTADFKTDLVDAMGAPHMGLLDRAVLVVRVAPTLASLVGVAQSTNVAVEPQVLDFSGQYVQISILYSSDGGVTTNEIEQLPATLPVVLNLSGTSVAKQVAGLDGAAIWGHPDSVDNGFATTVPAGQSWTKREGSTLDSFANVMSVDLAYTSIFGAFETQLSITDVVLGAGTPAGGNTVSVNGAFPVRTGVADNAAYTVTFDGMAATVTGAANDGAGTLTSLDVTVPASATVVNLSADVTVTDASTPSDFVTLPGGYVYAVTPTVLGVNPAFGPIVSGPPVTVTGTNLTSADTPGIGQVLFGTLLATNVVVAADGLSLTCTPPDAAGPMTVDVTVITAGGSDTLANGYTYLSPPTFVDFNPKTSPAAGGATMTIAGTNIFPVDVLTIAGVAANTATVVDVNGDGTVITVTIPMGTLGQSGIVTVVTPGGAASSVDVFTYTGGGAFIIDSISPNNAWAFGGLVASIQGSGFTAKGAFNTSVTIGGVNAPVISASATEILVKVPAMNVPLAGGGSLVSDLAVTDASGTGILPGAFTHYSFIRRAGDNYTTTAQTLSTGSGAVSIVLDGDTFNTSNATATLNVPSTVFNTGGATVVLARATDVAGTFGTASNDGNGTNVDMTYTAFDVHMFTDTGLNTATGTVFNSGSTLVEITNDLVFAIGSEATLSTPVGAGSITVTNALLGLTNVFRDVPTGANSTTLDYGSPMGSVGFGAGMVEQFQSNILLNEYLDTNADNNIDNFTNLRIRGLGTIMVRDNSVLRFGPLGLNPILDPAGPQSSMVDAAPVPVSILSALGGLGYVGRVDIIERGLGSSKVIARTSISLDALFSGEAGGEGQVDVTMPTVGEPGVVDIELFVPGDLNTPAGVIVNAFRYRGRILGGPLAALLAVLAVLGLAGSGGGGGSGGPCFIATAAYGTPMAAEIDTLRNMRDAYMLDNAVGAAFVDLYYQISPAIADVVAQSPALAAMVRLLLTPIILVGNMAMAMPTLSAALALMAFGMAIARRVRRKQS